MDQGVRVLRVLRVLQVYRQKHQVLQVLLVGQEVLDQEVLKVPKELKEPLDQAR